MLLVIVRNYQATHHHKIMYLYYFFVLVGCLYNFLIVKYWYSENFIINQLIYN